MAQNIQLHYDLGRALYKSLDERPWVATTVEMFKADKWGSTYFFVDMDYTDKGVSSAYWEISRELKFWKAPVSAHVEYNGGLNYINNAFLGGATYALNGNVQKVANNIFVFAPENVAIFAEGENKPYSFGGENGEQNPWK